MAPGSPLTSSASSYPFPDGLLSPLLAISLSAINLLRPVYGPDGAAIVDFTLDYLNPAAQRMAGLPEQPGITALARFPEMTTTGVFDFYRRAYATGTPETFEINYQADGIDNYFRLAAQRHQDLLVVSFTDTADQPRTAVEVTLRAAQAAERAARADAEQQRTELHSLLEQAPVAVTVYRGPQFRVELANAATLAIWDRPLDAVLGRPVFEVLPEAATPDVVAIFERVFATGTSHTAREQATTLHRHGQPETVYWNFVFQPQRGPDGRISGIISVGTDITAQVRARQQVEQLNQELESRVQKRTRQLQAQSQRLERLFAQAPAAICILAGPELVFELVNPIYQQFFPDRPLLGKPLLEALPEFTDHAAYHTMRRVFDTGETNAQQALHAPVARRADGLLEDRYFTYVQQPRYDEGGRIDGVLVFGFEVTELVQTRQQADVLQTQLLTTSQQQAAERESLYRVFAQTPAVVALLRDPGHRFEYVNPAYQALFPGRPLVGRNVAEAAPELVAQGFGALLDEVYRSGKTYFGQELPFTPPPAPGQAPRTAYYNFTYQAYREDGAVAGVSIFAYDVTEQVLARRERAAQQQQLREVFEQAPVAIFVLRGEEYVFEVVNPSMGQMLGSPPEQVLGQRYFDLLPALANQGYRDLLSQVWHTGQEYVAHEQAAQLPHHRAGEPGYYNFTYVPLRDDEDRTTGIMCVAMDVTPQVRARQQVQQLNQALQATNEELGSSNQQLVRTNVDLDNFIYTASHDLKAPISNIEGLLDTLRDELPAQAAGGEVPYILDLMQDSVNRFTRTIEHLTDVSRLQKEYNQPSEPVPLAGIIEDVRLDLAPLLQQTRGRLHVDVRAVPTVQFSVKNLRSVVYNLLSNALKYGHPDRVPLVQVRGREEGAYHVLEVQDNGLGLDLTREQELFGMFRRYHSHVAGSGIGLYMVKRMAENAGGRIEVNSTLGEGSTFTVYFPRP